MGKPNRPMPLADEDEDERILETAFRKVAERIGTPASDGAEGPFDVRGAVYPGTMPGPSGSVPEGTVSKNRRPSAKKVSTFNVVVFLLAAAVASVLYISNVITVGRVTAEIGALEERFRTIRNEQELLRAEIARLSGLERIRAIAERQFGMKYADAVPGWLTVNPERVAQFETLSRQAGARSRQ